jgi:hypothetical protein
MTRNDRVLYKSFDCIDYAEQLRVSACPSRPGNGTKRRCQNARVISEAGRRPAVPFACRPRRPLTHKRHAISRDDVCRIQERFSVAEPFLRELRTLMPPQNPPFSHGLDPQRTPQGSTLLWPR